MEQLTAEVLSLVLALCRLTAHPSLGVQTAEIIAYELGLGRSQIGAH